MTYYIFRAGVGTETAITDDQTGGKLPRRTGAWIYERLIELKQDDPPRIGSTSSEIISAVEQVGYFILPNPDMDESWH
jgi:hypothetical protein